MAKITREMNAIRSFRLDIDLLAKLWVLIQDQGPNSDIAFECHGNREYDSDSIDTLTQYVNEYNTRIKIIRLASGYRSKCRIFINIRSSGRIYASFSGNDVDNVDRCFKDFERAFRTHRMPYWFLYNKPFFSYIITLMMCSSINFIIFKIGMYNMPIIGNFTYKLSLLYISLIGSITYIICEVSKRFIFRPAVFLIGEGIRRYRTSSTIRNWCFSIFIAILVGVASNKVTSILF